MDSAMLSWNIQRSANSDNKRVLIIDDSPLILRNIKMMLQDQFEVNIATDGEMGIQKAKLRRPDIILLDVEMPVMDGKETFDRLSFDEQTADIPVIFLTSVSEGKKVVEILERHPAGYILKPADRDKLIEKINQALEPK